MLRLLALFNSRRPRARLLLSIAGIALGVALGYAVQLVNRAAVEDVAAARARGRRRSRYRSARRARRLRRVALSSDRQAARTWTSSARFSSSTSASRDAIARCASLASTSSAPAFCSPRWCWTSAMSCWLRTRCFSPPAPRPALGLGKATRCAWSSARRAVGFEVAAVLPSSALRGQAALVDIAAAQWRFERLGELNRLDIRLQAARTARARACRDRAAAAARRARQRGREPRAGERLSVARLPGEPQRAGDGGALHRRPARLLGAGAGDRAAPRRACAAARAGPARARARSPGAARSRVLGGSGAIVGPRRSAMRWPSSRCARSARTSARACSAASRRSSTYRRSRRSPIRRRRRGRALPGRIASGARMPRAPARSRAQGRRRADAFSRARTSALPGTRPDCRRRRAGPACGR